MGSFTRARPSVRSPSFFQVMVGDFSKDLRIPPVFIKHFDGVVPLKSEITRSTPDGKVWCVYAKKIDQCFFFRKGWREFVEENFIESGDFLVFHYVGNSKFEVVIYGKHFCEKELPPEATLQENVKRGKGQIGKSGKGTNIIGKRGSEEPGERKKINAADKIQEIKRNEVIVIKSDSCCSDHEMDTDDSNGSSDESSDTTENEKYQPSPAGKLKKTTAGVGGVRRAYEVKAKALKAASKFVSNYPFFIVVMQSSYLLANYLWIPEKFSRIHLKGGSRKVKLWASDSDRFWTVKLLFNQNGRGMFTSGWAHFVKDNALRMGDICFFEMLQSKRPLIKVSFFKSLR